MKSEKMVMPPVPAPENAGEQFELEAPRHQGGGTHDPNDRGYGSGIGVAQRGENNIELEAPETPTVPDFVADPFEDINPPAPDQNWQQMYGQSENEKGQWRKTANEAMTELAQLKAELGVMRNATSPATPGYPAQYSTPQQPAQAQQAQMPETFFPDKSPDDIVETKDVDALVRNVVGPAVMQLQQQQQQLYAETLAAQKRAAGITPDVEAKMAAECPWLQSIPEGPARIQAMQGYAQQRRQAQPGKAAPATAQVSPDQAAARRVTYIESGKAATPSESEVPVQQRIAQEWAQAKNAADKKAILIKYGMQHVNDWGPDVWGPAR
jgi:hypothetical protein